MSVDLSKVEVDTKVKLRNGSVHKVAMIRKIGTDDYPFFVYFKEEFNKSFSRYGAYAGSSEYDIIEILSSEEPKEETCLWSYDRDVPDHPDMPIWKTSCGYEFDRLKGCEQPRKHLRMEFCPYCGKHITDATTDC